MTAFAGAVTTLFRDRNLAVDALWRSGGTGPAQAVRVIRRSPDATVGFGDGRFAVDTDSVMLPLSAVPALAPGDTLQIGAELLVIAGEPMRDARRLVWTAQVRSP